jgi:hypothetical protein
MSNRAKKIYDALVSDVEDTIGSGSTLDETLDNYGKKVIGQQFGGVFPSDRIPDSMARGTKYFIVNKDKHNQPGSHWIGVVVYRKRMFFYDSFGRSVPMLVPELRQFQLQHGLSLSVPMRAISAPEQQIREENCGARSMAWLILFNRMGFRVARMISE